MTQRVALYLEHDLAFEKALGISGRTVWLSPEDAIRDSRLSSDRREVNHPRLHKMHEVALATKQLLTILEGATEMKTDIAQRELNAVVTLLHLRVEFFVFEG